MNKFDFGFHPKVIKNNVNAGFIAFTRNIWNVFLMLGSISENELNINFINIYSQRKRQCKYL